MTTHADLQLAASGSLLSLAGGQRFTVTLPLRGRRGIARARRVLTPVEQNAKRSSPHSSQERGYLRITLFLNLNDARRLLGLRAAAARHLKDSSSPQPVPLTRALTHTY